MTARADNSCEVGWFSALCDDDYEFLGVPDPALQSSFAHCRDITLAAETGGFGDLPGESLASEPRYRRTLEYMTLLRSLLLHHPR